MANKIITISFPYIGKYTDLFKEFLENFGVNVILPPKITDKTIKIGTRYSSEMMCLTGDTKVTVEDFTSKPIKDIKIGDNVLTHKGRFRKVTHFFSRNYNDEIVNINCGGLLNFNITPKHPILSLSSKNLEDSPKFIQSQKLKRGDFLVIPIPKLKRNRQFLEWSKEYKYPLKYKFNKFYFLPNILRVLGYYLAEGSIIYNRRKTISTEGISFVFNSEEEKYIQEIIKIINDNFTCFLSQRSQKSSVKEILVYSKVLADIFRYLCGENSDEKKIGKELMQLNPKLQLELVKGFFRGDGHLEKKTNHYSCATVSNDLANQLFWILIRNNIKPSFFTGKLNNRKRHYILKIFNRGDINFIDNTIILSEKLRLKQYKYIKKEGYILVPIRSITKKKFKGRVYNLEVAGDNSYVANFLAVHNCFPYKVTLGNFIELLEQNHEIDYLIMYDSRGRCRFRHYYILQKQTLEKLGFKTKMIALNLKNLLNIPKTLNPKLNKAQIIKHYFWLYKKIRQISKHNEMAKDKPNILLIGEIYTCLEPAINYHLEERLRKFGINLINSVNLFSFVIDSVKNVISYTCFRDKYYLRAKNYLNGPIGGHGVENIASVLKYLNKDIEGVIWLRPLSCMPETTIDPIIKTICQENNLPLLIFDIDESNFALNIETRLETFIEQVKLDYETKKMLPRV